MMMSGGREAGQADVAPAPVERRYFPRKSLKRASSTTLSVDKMEGSLDPQRGQAVALTEPAAVVAVDEFS
jgi:hypothetical protein